MIKKAVRFSFLLLVFVCAVVFFAWNHLRQGMETLNNQLPERLTLSHSQHYIDEFGRLVLIEPMLLDNRVGVIFTAEKLFYKPNSWQDYFSISDRLILADYPQTGNFELTGLSIPLLSLSNYQSQGFDTTLSRIFMAGCGSVTDLSLTAFAEMGYDKLTGDLKLQYTFEAGTGKLGLHVQSEFANFSKTNFSLKLRDFFPKTGRTPYLTQSEIVLIEPKWVERKNQFCAAEIDTTVSDFQTENLRAVKNWFEAEKIKPSKELEEGYKTFNINHTSFAFSANPPTGIPLDKFEELPLSNKFEQLNLSVNINGNAINSLFSKINEPVVEETLEQPEKEVNPNLFLRPSQSQLIQLRFQPLVLTDENGTQYKGEITEVNDKVISLQIRKSGGFAIIRFNINKVEAVELTK